MKNTSSIVLSVLLLIFLFVGLTSSKNKEPDQYTTMQSRLVYPATPKAIFTKNYRYADDVVADIKAYSTRGYIVKSCTGTGYGSFGESWILVMEKY